MARLIPNEGEIQSLTEFLSAGEAFFLKLFKSNTTPAETDTPASYTLVTTSDFPGYADKTLTRSVSGSTWNTPASGAPTNAWSVEASVAESVYGSTAQSWTNNGGSPVTVYGYILVGATSGKLRGVETFDAPRTLQVADTLEFFPRFGFA